MEILIGLVLIAALGYLVFTRRSDKQPSTQDSEGATAPYKVEVAPVIVTTPKAEPVPAVQVSPVAEATPEKPAKAKKPKAAAIKSKVKTETTKEVKTKAPKKPKTLKVAK